MPEKPELKILALDTSSVRGSVALLRSGDVVGEIRLASLETHSARLLKSVEFLLESAGWRIQELKLIAACIGPGSFTGIRIGVATALGLAQTLGIPYAGVSGLDAVARQSAFLEGRVAVAMDAQRSQVYYAEYQCENGRVRRASRPILAFPNELERRIKSGKLHLVGDGAHRYFKELEGRSIGWPRLISMELFLAAATGIIAMERRRTWQTAEFLQSEPLYIRPPDAMRPRSR